MADYARPDSLVSTDWVAENLNNPKVRLIEVDVDTAAYDTGHAPGAVGWNWKKDLETEVTRDIADKEGIEKLLSEAGVTPDTTVVLYGDNSNWFAAYALWVLNYYGVDNVKLMNGGRKKWVDEARPLNTEAPKHAKTSVTVKTPKKDIRAVRDEVMAHLAKVSSGKGALGRCAGPERVFGRAAGTGEPAAGGFAAGRAYPGRKEHSVGNRNERGRNIQVGGRAQGDLRRPGSDSRQGHHRLLPHRRAIGAHLVRADPATWIPQRPQL